MQNINIICPITNESPFNSPNPQKNQYIQSQAQSYFSSKPNEEFNHNNFILKTARVSENINDKRNTPQNIPSSTVNYDSNINQGKKQFHAPLGSSSTLVDTVNISSILGEKQSTKFSDISLNEFLSRPSLIKKTDSKKTTDYLTISFRVFNFLRALATALYSYVITIRGLNDANMINIGAKNLLITSLLATTVDLIVPFVRLFPQIFWCFWDVTNWDPYSKTWTVWALIADHDLLIDISPILINVVIKLYIYRVSELLENPMIKDTVTNPDIAITSLNDIFKYQNFIILMLFVGSIVYTILYHGARIWYFLSFQKRSRILGVIALVKSFLFTFDILTNGLLFYKCLVFKGIEIFDMFGFISIALSVVSISPIITLTTNTIVNIPMHFCNFRMRLQERKNSTEMVGFKRLFMASCRQSFHVILTPLFVYAVYSTIALFYLLTEMKEIDKSAGVLNLVPPSDFFGWNGSKTSNVLLGMLWTNVVLNYLTGILTWIIWNVFNIAGSISIFFAKSV